VSFFNPGNSVKEEPSCSDEHSRRDRVFWTRCLLWDLLDIPAVSRCVPGSSFKINCQPHFNCLLLTAPTTPNNSPLDALTRMPQFQAGTGVQSSSADPKNDLPEVRIRNRRRKYLDTHPEYLNDPELELAGLFFSPFHSLVTLTILHTLYFGID
jgi:hypothetical protein